MPRKVRVLAGSGLHHGYNRHAWGGVVVVLLAFAFLTPRVGSGAERMTLEDANSRWRGARCRSRAPITLAGKVDREGRVASQWIAWMRPGATNPNAPPEALGRLGFSDGDSLLRSYRGGIIPAGTVFEVVGWGEEKRGGPIYLEVRLPGIEVGGRLGFYSPKPPPFRRKLQLKRLSDCERWARFEVFEIVESPDERLVEVETAPEAQRLEPAPTSAARATAQTAAAQVFAPTVTLHAVTVQPARVSPGGEVELALTYEIGGVPPNSRFQVTERRQLTFGGRELRTFDEQVARGAGAFTSRLPVHVPADAVGGLYSVEASVELAGLTSAGTASFQVTEDLR